MAKSKAEDSKSAGELRERAEHALGSREEKRHKPLTLDQATRLLHELEVHQIELEMQNDELRRSRLEIELFRNKYQDLYDHAPVGYISFDLSGEIKEINLAAAQLLGKSRQELLNRSFLPFVAVEQRDNFRTFCRVSFQSQVREVCELKLGLFPDPTISAELVGRASLIAPGTAEKLLRVAIFDVTQRNRLQRDRNRLIKEARSAQSEAEAANRAKDEFLAVLSHELRTPLMPMLGWTRLMQGKNCDAAIMSKGLEVIQRNLKMQTRLVEDLLDVSRIVAGKLLLNSTLTELKSIVEQSVDDVRATAESKKIKLEFTADTGEFTLIGDATRLRQIVGILLDNALKFTPVDGTVATELRRDNAGVALKVSDTGVGIDPEMLPHVFERFTQADAACTREFRGLGLGLSIARHLVDAHGGRIEATSSGENRGTVMTVNLPLSQQTLGRVPEIPKSPGKRKTLNLRGARILLVEDEKDTRDLLALGLERYGAVVNKTGSAPDALSAFNKAVPDLILADIGLPGEDGCELMQAIRSHPKGTKVPAIALTAFAQEEDRQRAFKSGFQSHYAKPLDFPSLAEAINELICAKN